MSITVKLSKPIKAHAEEVGELTIREPTTQDVIELGLPMLIVIGDDGRSTGVEIRPSVVARYLSRLAAIPKSSVESLYRQDFSRCTAAVMGFFGVGDGETPTS